MRFNEFAPSDFPIKLYHSTVDIGPRAYRAHYHSAFEISACMKGGGIYNVGGREYPFSPGDLFVFSTDENHCVTQVEGPVFELINIQFEPRFLWSYKGLLQLFFNRSENFSNKFPTGHPTTQKIFSNIHLIEKEFSENKPENKLKISTILIEILIDMIRDFDYVDFEKDFSGYTSIPNELEKVITYINDNLDKDLSLEELAKTATMSRTYFCTVFKKFNGISPWDYITIKRVEKSIEMLKYTDKNTLEIASACGFNSSSNFYKAFKKITGKTPGEYVK